MHCPAASTYRRLGPVYVERRVHQGAWIFGINDAKQLGSRLARDPHREGIVDRCRISSVYIELRQHMWPLRVGVRSMKFYATPAHRVSRECERANGCVSACDEKP